MPSSASAPPNAAPRVPCCTSRPPTFAGLAVVPRVVIEEFEGGGAPLSPADLLALRQALEQAGVLFLDADHGGGPGVRLRVMNEE
ncbi:MAG: hypothetical protein JO105_01655 [Hyphomicrobiales bacterium]|nr:hypothetical protein [Hyphomicrobiales bacterium]